MKVSKFRVPSTDGVHDLHVKLYEPDSSPKVLIQIVHGMAEHIERYDGVMSYLCSCGFAVCAHDHIGHGKTVADACELGYFAEKDGWKILVEDVGKVKEEVLKKIPDSINKVVLFGHSMGSFVVRMAYPRFDYDALIACGTGGKNTGVGLGIALGKMIKFFKGEKCRSHLLNAMIFGEYNTKFGKRGGFEWLTRDADIVKIHDADELCTFTFSVSALIDLMKLNKYSNSKKWFNDIDKEKPLLLIAGTDDPVGNYGKGVKQVYDNLISEGHKNARLKLYDGARHEILNEINKNEVNKDLADFICSVAEA